MNINRAKKGFVATIAVVMLSSVFFSILVGVQIASVSYADGVYKKFARIQAGLNAEACLDTMQLMISINFYLHGTVSLPEFGCTAEVLNDLNGSTTIKLVAVFNNVSSYK